MKEEAQRIAIAEACGWKRFNAEDRKEWYYKDLKGLYWQHPTIKSIEHTADGLYDYLNDLNAMHEAEKVLTDEQRVEYVSRQLWGIVPDKHRFAHYFFATAAQRAEAFLKTLNLWKD